MNDYNFFAEGYACANIALIKYWGKRDEKLHLPFNSSLSLPLLSKGTYTRIALAKQKAYFINGLPLAKDSLEYQSLEQFLTTVIEKYHLSLDDIASLKIESFGNIPIATGLASSASYYASLAIALNNFFKLNLSEKDLSILARLGSGSACRSVFEEPAFVFWSKGHLENGHDSFAFPLPYKWPELQIGILNLDQTPKKISSRVAMKSSVESSPLFPKWLCKVRSDINRITLAIKNKDFALFGETLESNSEFMHEVIKSSQLNFDYSSDKTLAAKEKIAALRAKGIPVYFSQDAGSNLVLFFLAPEISAIKETFPTVEIIAPFAENEEITLVNEHDTIIGTTSKMEAHKKGLLHRAFSVVILKSNSVASFLMQLRAKEKYHSGNLWSNACCSHPKANENIIMAAQKRLKEELGLTVPLTPIGSFIYKEALDNDLVEYELDHVLIGFIENNALIKLDPKEASAYTFISLPALKRDLENSLPFYTKWLPNVVKLTEQYLQNTATKI